MPRKGTYAGIGATGLRKSPRMAADVRAALREKKLEAKVAKKQKQIRRGQKVRPISERAKKRLVRSIQSPARRIRDIQARAADLRERAKKVERSKTGNKRAAATYRQAASELLARIPALRAKGK